MDEKLNGLGHTLVVIEAFLIWQSGMVNKYC